jgi:hypothetical protein
MGFLGSSVEVRTLGRFSPSYIISLVVSLVILYFLSSVSLQAKIFNHFIVVKVPN